MRKQVLEDELEMEELSPEMKELSPEFHMIKASLDWNPEAMEEFFDEISVLFLPKSGEAGVFAPSVGFCNLPENLQKIEGI